MTIPAIEHACLGTARDMGMAARIVLAAELSVKVNLPAEVMRLLRDVGTIERDD